MQYQFRVRQQRGGLDAVAQRRLEHLQAYELERAAPSA
jgi:hypothetical protein